MEPEPTDADLLRRVADGDVEAFGALVRRHQAAVVAVAFAIVRDRDLALDLAQEAFVKAWRRTAEVRDPDRVGAWLCGVVRFLARDHRRRERRRDDLRAGLDGAAPGATPLDAVIAGEDERLLARVVDELPATYREPLLLHHVAGCSVAEIARALALGEDAVKQRLSRGRAALRDALAHAGADEPRFARAALAVAPTATFTQATLDAAALVPQAPPGAAAPESFMSSHPFLAIALSTAAAGAVGLALATTFDDSPAAPGTPTAAAPAATRPAGDAPPAAGAPDARGARPRRDVEPDDLAAAVRAARARGAAPAPGTDSAAMGATGAGADGPAKKITYDFSGETITPAVAEAPAPELVPLEPGAPLTKASVRDALAPLRYGVAACYVDALARTPELDGTVTLRLVIIQGDAGLGRIINSQVESGGEVIDDPQLSSCVMQAAMSLEVPGPEGRAQLIVHYPYTLEPR